MSHSGHSSLSTPFTPLSRPSPPCCWGPLPQTHSLPPAPRRPRQGHAWGKSQGSGNFRIWFSLVHKGGGRHTHLTLGKLRRARAHDPSSPSPDAQLSSVIFAGRCVQVRPSQRLWPLEAFPSPAPHPYSLSHLQRECKIFTASDHHSCCLFPPQHRARGHACMCIRLLAYWGSPLLDLELHEGWGPLLVLTRDPSVHPRRNSPGSCEKAYQVFHDSVTPLSPELVLGLEINPRVAGWQGPSLVAIQQGR